MIEIEEAFESGTRSRVLKRTKIGESFTGALCKAPEQRNVLKKGEPVVKPNGKFRQELVLTMVTVESTMRSSLADESGVPEPGDVVRAIIRGKSFGDWIDSKGKLTGPLRVGDIVEMTTTHAQAYDHDGDLSGKPITSQADADAVPRGQTLGYYGDISIRRSTTAEAKFVDMAEAEFVGNRPAVESPSYYDESAF